MMVILKGVKKDYKKNYKEIESILNIKVGLWRIVEKIFFKFFYKLRVLFPQNIFNKLKMWWSRFLDFKKNVLEIEKRVKSFSRIRELNEDNIKDLFEILKRIDEAIGQFFELEKHFLGLRNSMRSQIKDIEIIDGLFNYLKKISNLFRRINRVSVLNGLYKNIENVIKKKIKNLLSKGKNLIKKFIGIIKGKKEVKSNLEVNSTLVDIGGTIFAIIVIAIIFLIIFHRLIFTILILLKIWKRKDLSSSISDIVNKSDEQMKHFNEIVGSSSYIGNLMKDLFDEVKEKIKGKGEKEEEKEGLSEEERKVLHW